MGIKEAIEYLIHCADGYDPEFDEAVLLVTSAVRTQLKQEDPEPLTVEELLGMDGEPVWIVCKDNCPPHWRIWHNSESFDMSVFEAYRHKPKEETI